MDPIVVGRPRPCDGCLETYAPLTGVNRFCSKLCATREVLGIRPFRECRVCGGHYPTSRSRHGCCEQHVPQRQVTVVWPDLPSVCAYCTDPIPAGREFCSSTCAGASTRLSRMRVCVQCGLPWRVHRPESSATHCPECRYERPEGVPPAEMSSGMKRARRRQLIERDGEWCSCCGAPEGLEIHHVKHQEHGGTHALENLKFLCGPCHDGVHGRHLAPPLPLAA